MRKKWIYLLLTACVLWSCSDNEEQTLVLESEADLAGLRIATQSGSCYDIELSPRTDIELQRFNTLSDALQALRHGNADVLLNDETALNAYICREQGIKPILRGEKAYPTSFMFPKQATELAEAFNVTLARLKAEGTYDRIIDYWLNDRYIDADTFPSIPVPTEGEPIRVANVCATAPLSFMSGGEWYGLEMDLLREFANDLNRPLDIKYYDVTAAIMSIKTNKADLLSGGVFITPERQLEFAFGDPYYYFHSTYFALDTDSEINKSGFVARFQHAVQKNLLAEDRWRFITDGLLLTLIISFFAILFGSLLGILVYRMGESRHPWARSIAKVYNGFIAGIPELVLLLVLFYVVFAKSGLSAEVVAIIAFAMCFASSAADIYKTSLDAVPHGQTEAGLALGFTPVQTFFNIIFPQAMKRGLPLYKGLCINILKATSIVGYIAIQDLTRAGDLIRSRTFDALVPLLVVTVLYFLLVWLLAALFNLITRGLSRPHLR